MLLINAAAPYLVYMVCKPHVGGFVALALSAVPPTLESLWSILRRRRLDVMGALVLGGIAVSLALIALGGSERILLLRESLVTSVVGLVFAASVVFRRPLLYYLARQMSTGGDAAQVAAWDRRWDDRPGFRRSMRVLSLFWGLGLVIEMVVRTIMVFEMEVSSFLLISPFVQYGLTGLMALWTVFYAKRRRADLPDDAPEPAAGSPSA
jgi:hypothetical protein